MSESTYAVLGYDVGGTKIAVSACDTEGNILASERVKTRSTDPYEKALPDLIEAGKSVITQAGLTAGDIRGCGVAAPGPIDVPNGVMLRSPNMVWDQAPIRDDLEQALGVSVFFDNDANGGALAEWYFGAGKGCHNLVYLTLSTGIGGGVIVNDTLMQGGTGLAGELGHVILDTTGPYCGCGLRGCLEAFCGGRSVQRRLRHIMEDRPVQEILDLVDGDLDELAYPALREAAKRGVPFAVEMWDEICMRLAQGMGIHLMTFNPEKIVLGTLALYSGDFLMKPLLEYLPRYAWQQMIDGCTIETTALGTRIGELAGPAVALYGIRSSQGNR